MPKFCVDRHHQALLALLPECCKLLQTRSCVLALQDPMSTQAVTEVDLGNGTWVQKSRQHLHASKCMLRVHVWAAEKVTCKMLPQLNKGDFVRCCDDAFEHACKPSCLQEAEHVTCPPFIMHLASCFRSLHACVCYRADCYPSSSPHCSGCPCCLSMPSSNSYPKPP